MNRQLESLLRFIENDVGFATSHYNEAYLQRRITARIRRLDVSEYGEYLDLLRRNESEQSELLRSLSINVTGFFRNPKMWDSLRCVLREITDTDGRTAVWSAPCSDGREPYSIAMLALADPDINTAQLEIRGTDISDDSLVTARSGAYKSSRLSDIESELSYLDDYDRYIDRQGEQFVVQDSVRELVTFEHHDLIRDNSPGEFDLVLCRNLLIYMAPEYKAPILETIDTSIIKNGYITIGMTETLPKSYKQKYDSAHRRAKIYRKEI